MKIILDRYENIIYAYSIRRINFLYFNNLIMEKIMNTKQIIAKLKNQIAKKGYSENLGQKELRQYEDYLGKQKSQGKITWEEASDLATDFQNEIHNL